MDEKEIHTRPAEHWKPLTQKEKYLILLNVGTILFLGLEMVQIIHIIMLGTQYNIEQ